MKGKPNKWKVVWFEQNARFAKEVPNAKVGLAIVERMRRGGTKVHLVSCRRAFPPKGDEPLDTKMWCPYCRKWRDFVVPFGDDDAIMVNPDGSINLNAYYSLCRRSEIRVCLWCTVSVQDFWVKMYNPDLWTDAVRRRRVKRKRR